MAGRLSAKAIILQRIDHQMASRFFYTYEHLGDCGLGVWHWGAFIDRSLVAAVSFGTTCFGRGRGPVSKIAAHFGLNLYQITRGGTSPTAPFNTASWAVSSALSELHRFRGDCLVVAYADRRFNEIGTIYQACNAIYMGPTDPKNQSNYVINGRRMSGWVVRKRFGGRSMNLLRRVDESVTKIPLNSKYRYVFIKASPQKRRHIINALLPLAQPYPKRGSENIERMDVSGLIRCRLTPGRPSEKDQERENAISF